MIVQRQTFETKPGHMEERIKILQELWKLWDDPPTYRIYRPITGPRNVIHQEIEFEDYEARERFWAQVPSLAGVDPLMEEWRKGSDGGGSELLRLVE